MVWVIVAVSSREAGYAGEICLGTRARDGWGLRGALVIESSGFARYIVCMQSCHERVSVRRVDVWRTCDVRSRVRAPRRAKLVGVCSSEQIWADADGQGHAIMQIRRREATRCSDWM